MVLQAKIISGTISVRSQQNVHTRRKNNFLSDIKLEKRTGEREKEKQNQKTLFMYYRFCLTNQPTKQNQKMTTTKTD